MRLTMRSRLSRSLVTLGKVDIVFLRFPNISLAYCPHFRHRPLLDPLLERYTLKNAFHVDARCMHRIGIEAPGFNQLFDLGNRDLSRGCHHGIEIARSLAIDEVTPCVALPGFDEGKVSFQ